MRFAQLIATICSFAVVTSSFSEINERRAVVGCNRKCDGTFELCSQVAENPTKFYFSCVAPRAKCQQNCAAKFSKRHFDEMAKKDVFGSNLFEADFYDTMENLDIGGSEKQHSFMKYMTDGKIQENIKLTVKKI